MSVAVVSIHDVAPATRDECTHLLSLVERLGARASLLVVPGPWRLPVVGDDVDFIGWLRRAEAAGHEVVAHGWEHRSVHDPTTRHHLGRSAGERLLTRGCAEFAGLGHDEAARRAGWSLDALRTLGFSPVGFVAPGWSLSAAASEALRSVGFGYTTTRTTVVDYLEPKTIPVPAVCHRPRSALSMLAARMVVAVVEMRCRERRSIRLALHPDDVHDGRLDRATVRALDVLASSSLELMTYVELVDACRLAGDSSERAAS
ncbi:MAG TPA: polysaccharide deacetylase family protein [Ilumatobacteraceae bacterium]|nr:polysaccharide deacetylase family protein [Ilumatobacteraceae bacterium]